MHGLQDRSAAPANPTGQAAQDTSNDLLVESSSHVVSTTLLTHQGIANAFIGDAFISK
jgi:hypothetical protein